MPVLQLRATLSRTFSSSTSAAVTVDNVLSKGNESRCKAQLAAMSQARDAAADHARAQGKKSRTAAVLVPLCTVNCQPSILFTLRSNKLYTHRGEVSFPGGMVESHDKNVISAALRESYEELGLSPQAVNVWGTMPALLSRDGVTIVTPVIGNVGAVDVEKMKLNFDEVECVFTRNILSLCSPKNVGTTTFRSNQAYTMPVFLGGEHRIWGMTAYILHQTLTVLAPEPIN